MIYDTSRPSGEFSSDNLLRDKAAILSEAVSASFQQVLPFGFVRFPDQIVVLVSRKTIEQKLQVPTGVGGRGGNGKFHTNTKNTNIWNHSNRSGQKWSSTFSKLITVIIHLEICAECLNAQAEGARLTKGQRSCFEVCADAVQCSQQGVGGPSTNEIFLSDGRKAWRGRQRRTRVFLLGQKPWRCHICWGLKTYWER